jgi:ketosteroid isomerase-like protein
MTVANDFSTEMFRRSDSFDVEGWASMMTDDVHFKFGNADPIDGRANVIAAIHMFFDSIAGIKHQVLDEWRVSDKLIQQLVVTYTRHDGKVLELPAANILTLRGDQIAIYQIYVDNSQLYA